MIGPVLYVMLGLLSPVSPTLLLIEKAALDAPIPVITVSDPSISRPGTPLISRSGSTGRRGNAELDAVARASRTRSGPIPGYSLLGGPGSRTQRQRADRSPVSPIGSSSRWEPRQTGQNLRTPRNMGSSNNRRLRRSHRRGSESAAAEMLISPSRRSRARPHTSSNSIRRMSQSSRPAYMRRINTDRRNNVDNSAMRRLRYPGRRGPRTMADRLAQRQRNRFMNSLDRSREQQRYQPIRHLRQGQRNEIRRQPQQNAYRAFNTLLDRPRNARLLNNRPRNRQRMPNRLDGPFGQNQRNANRLGTSRRPQQSKLKRLDRPSRQGQRNANRLDVPFRQRQRNPHRSNSGEMTRSASRGPGRRDNYQTGHESLKPARDQRQYKPSDQQTFGQPAKGSSNQALIHINTNEPGTYKILEGQDAGGPYKILRSDLTAHGLQSGDHQQIAPYSPNSAFPDTVGPTNNPPEPKPVRNKNRSTRYNANPTNDHRTGHFDPHPAGSGNPASVRISLSIDSPNPVSGYNFKPARSTESRSTPMNTHHIGPSDPHPNDARPSNGPHSGTPSYSSQPGGPSNSGPTHSASYDTQFAHRRNAATPYDKSKGAVSGDLYQPDSAIPNYKYSENLNAATHYAASGSHNPDPIPHESSPQKISGSPPVKTNDPHHTVGPDPAGTVPTNGVASGTVDLYERGSAIPNYKHSANLNAAAHYTASGGSSNSVGIPQEQGPSQVLTTSGLVSDPQGNDIYAPAYHDGGYNTLPISSGVPGAADTQTHSGVQDPVGTGSKRGGSSSGAADQSGGAVGDLYQAGSAIPNYMYSANLNAATHYINSGGPAGGQSYEPYPTNPPSNGGVVLNIDIGGPRKSSVTSERGDPSAIGGNVGVKDKRQGEASDYKHINAVSESIRAAEKIVADISNSGAKSSNVNRGSSEGLATSKSYSYNVI